MSTNSFEENMHQFLNDIAGQKRESAIQAARCVVEAGVPEPPTHTVELTNLDDDVTGFMFDAEPMIETDENCVKVGGIYRGHRRQAVFSLFNVQHVAVEELSEGQRRRVSFEMEDGVAEARAYLRAHDPEYVEDEEVLKKLREESRS